MSDEPYSPHCLLPVFHNLTPVERRDDWNASRVCLLHACWWKTWRN